MRVLITGGLGTIGSCLTARMVKSGHDVTVYDNMEIGNVDNLKIYLHDDEVDTITIIQKDILDKGHISAAINNSDIVFHLAATLGTLNVVAQPSRMLNVNSMGTHFIADLATAKNIPLVLMSTSMVYGQNPKSKVSETDDLFVGGNLDVGLWWYAVSKMSDEAYANSIMLENKKAKILIIRPFNVIAPVQHHASGFVFPRFFKSALNNDPLLVYGDGEQRRTFTWAPEFVECLLRLVDGNIWRETFNIGGVESISIIELAHKIKEHTNSSSEIKLIEPQGLYNNQFVEIEQRTPDVSKLKSHIGTAPETSLDEMIVSFAKFYIEKFNEITQGHSRY